MSNKDLNYIDIHCHYDELSISQLKAEFNGQFQTSVCAAVSFNSFEKLEILRQENVPNLYFAYGLYPDVILEHTVEECLSQLSKIDFTKAIAIGEIGIDYKITKDPEKRKEQQIVFEKQLEIAKANNLPAIIHTRYATKSILEILKPYNGFPIILHWYSGSKDEIQTALDRGYYLTIRFNKPIIPNIKDYLDQIFIETDYPVPFEGNPIKVSDIEKSYEIFAKENDIDLKYLKEKMNDNFNKLFLKK